MFPVKLVARRPIRRGDTWTRSFRIETGGLPYVLTGYPESACQIRSVHDGAVLCTATVTRTGTGLHEFTITLSSAQTAALPLGRVIGDVEVRNNTANPPLVITVAEFEEPVTPDVTR